MMDPPQSGGHEGIQLPVDKVFHFLPLVRNHQFLQQEIFQPLEVADVVEGVQLRVGIVDQMEQILIQIQFQQENIDIVNQSLVFFPGSLDAGILACHIRQRQRHIEILAVRRQTVGIGPGHCFQIFRDMFKAFQQLGRKSTAISLEDHIHGGVEGIGFFVYPLGGQGIVDICQTDYLGADGNVITGQTLSVCGGYYMGY